MSKKFTHWSPPRKCAICTERELNYPHRFCSTCFTQWEEAIKKEEPWVMALVEESNKDYNHSRRRQYREIPLGAVTEDV